MHKERVLRFVNFLFVHFVLLFSLQITQKKKKTIQLGANLF